MTVILTVYVLAMLMILAEMVMPSAILGIVGIGGLAGSIVWAWRDQGWPTGLVMLVVAVVVVPAAILRAVRNLTLQARLEGAGAEAPPGLLPGVEGRTVTPLRPTGVAIINGQRTDVLTNGEPVDRDAAIRVVAVEGNRIIVAPLERRIG